MSDRAEQPTRCTSCPQIFHDLLLIHWASSNQVSAYDGESKTSLELIIKEKAPFGLVFGIDVCWSLAVQMLCMKSSPDLWTRLDLLPGGFKLMEFNSPKERIKTYRPATLLFPQVHRQLYRECNGDYAQIAAMYWPRIMENFCAPADIHRIWIWTILIEFDGW